MIRSPHSPTQRPQSHCLLDISILHQEYISLAISLYAVEFFKICTYFANLRSLTAALQILHNVISISPAISASGR